MAFIVKKNIHGKEYFYLNENKREEGKVKTRTIAYLGKNKKDAEKKMKEILNSKDNKEKDKKMANEKKEINSKLEKKNINIEEMSVFCKRKGFVYPSAEIYGGLSGFWDYGHLGVELNNNIKKEWWKFHVQTREDIVGIYGSIITNPKVWKASGHIDSFSDVIAICKKCKKPNKFDKFELQKDSLKCPLCGGEIDKSGARDLNMMMTTQVGPDPETSILSYLRPETAQLIFINFKNILENARMKLPFGIAQIGKSFRNEIAPRDFLFRCREFEQMEIEYFINPEEKIPYEIPDVEMLVYSSEMQQNNSPPEKMKLKEAFEKGIIKTDWHAYWLGQEFLWFTSLGANPDKFRVRQHVSDEKSHYAIDTWDFEYEFPFGWKELHGMANRGDYDLKQHEKYSGKDLKVFDEKTKKKFLPHVVCEPSQGVERAFLVFMFDAYYYDEKRQNIVLKLHPKLSPVKAAIFPLVKTDENLVKIAKNAYRELKKDFNVIYDDSGSVGRRYARQDEAGTPFCITIDSDSFKNKDVTIRNRNDTKQIRVKTENIKDVITRLINNETEFEKAGKLI
jgi:glycyl-tRNA synthetase